MGRIHLPKPVLECVLVHTCTMITHEILHVCLYNVEISTLYRVTISKAEFDMAKLSAGTNLKLMTIHAYSTYQS